MASTTPSPIYYVNGLFVPAEKAVLPVSDLAIIRGYACFDYFRTYAGKPVTLKLSVQRLRRSCKQIDLELPWTDEELFTILNETLRKNQVNPTDEWGLRIIVSGGVTDNEASIFPQGALSLVIIANPILPKLDPILNSISVKIISVDINRILTTVKTTNYIPAILARKIARKSNAVEALYVNQGMISECTTSNIFAFYKDTLCTPDSNLLLGITRSLILDFAKEKFKLELGPISYSRLLEADEVFITSAGKGILPVIQIDNHKVGNGKPGQRTQVIKEMFYKRVGLNLASL